MDKPILANLYLIVLASGNSQESKFSSGGIGDGDVHLSQSASKRNRVMTAAVTFMTIRPQILLRSPKYDCARKPDRAHSKAGHPLMVAV